MAYRLIRQNAMAPQPIEPTPIALPIANNLEPDWECRICLDGQDDRNIVMHPCGNNHSFHEVCIVEWMRLNNQCPYCRCIAPEPGPIHVNLRRVPHSQQQCCRCALPIEGDHLQMIRCGHHLHLHCALDVIIETGVSHNGVLRCRICEQQ